jgi:hypothetical protein
MEEVRIKTCPEHFSFITYSFSRVNGAVNGQGKFHPQTTKIRKENFTLLFTQSKKGKKRLETDISLS